MREDDPFARPYSSFERPVPLVLVDPDSDATATVRFNPAWRAHIMGALKQLVQQTTWATDDPDALWLVQQRAMLLIAMFDLPPLPERPFYEDAEETDDEQLPEEPWYDTISDWIITGFLAVTFTPGAGIVYKATIPQIRLAFRTGNLGTIARVLLNDVEMWTGDTYAPLQDLLEKVLDIGAFAQEHELGDPPWALRIENAGFGEHSFGAPPIPLDDPPAYRLEVVRGDIRNLGMLQFRQLDHCTLQASGDQGESWDTIFNAYLCGRDAAADEISAEIANGILAVRGQQPPGGGLPPNQCETYQVTLDAKGKWLCPKPLSSGDTVQVASAAGGWWDGDPNSFWNCPEGSGYQLGQCTIIGRKMEQTDPLPTAWHMQVVANIGSDWGDPIAALWTIPSGHIDENLYLQANDSALGDNQGSAQLVVNVCRGGWAHTYDFTLDAFGFVPVLGGDQVALAYYVPGQGWHSVYDHLGLNFDECRFVKTLGQAAHYTGFQIVYYDVLAPSGLYTLNFQMDATSLAAPGNPAVVSLLLQDQTGANLRTDVTNALYSGNHPILVSQLTFYGDSVEPTW